MFRRCAIAVLLVALGGCVSVHDPASPDVGRTTTEVCAPAQQSGSVRAEADQPALGPAGVSEVSPSSGVTSRLTAADLARARVSQFPRETTRALDFGDIESRIVRASLATDVVESVEAEIELTGRGGGFGGYDSTTLVVRGASRNVRFDAVDYWRPLTADSRWPRTYAIETTYRPEGGSPSAAGEFGVVVRVDDLRHPAAGKVIYEGWHRVVWGAD